MKEFAKQYFKWATLMTIALGLTAIYVGLATRPIWELGRFLWRLWDPLFTK